MTWTAFPPAAGTVKISLRPVRVELNAIVLPSGLQAGAPSGVAVDDPVSSAAGVSKLVAFEGGRGDGPEPWRPAPVAHEDDGGARGVDSGMIISAQCCW